MNNLVIFSLLLIIIFIVVIFIVYISRLNRRIKGDLLGILKLNSKNYLKLFVGMANKENFNKRNMISLIKLKIDNIYSDYQKANKDVYILEKAIDILEYGILIISKDNFIYYINDQVGKLFNIPRVKQLHDKNIEDTQLNWILRFESGEVFEIPYEYTSTSISCYIENLDDDLRIYTFKNITDQKKLDTMSTEFISNITHELKTPLTSIMGFAETLKTVEDEEDRQVFYDIISKEAIRLNNLISDILVFSEIETNNDVNKQKIDIVATLHSIKQLLIPQLKSQEFNIHILGDKVSILGSESYIRQIFLNVIDNSIKHSLGKNLYINCTQDEKNLYVEFKDDGIGIPEGEIENIFDRFYKVSSSTTKSKGTGLGLSIVIRSVEKVNGKLEVFNNTDKGVTFRIVIPKNNGNI